MVKKMNDLINRHGVAAWLENMGHKKLANYIMDENRFPPASPEPKRGKWLLNGGRPCECSVCHHEGNEYGDARFCAYCGAMMKEGE